MRIRTAWAATCIAALVLMAPGQGVAQESKDQREARMAWWQAARFGLFIHWGPVSLKGTEIGWSRAGERRGFRGPGTEIPVDVYDNLYKEFNPTEFNARQWVAVAKAAGMRYLVFTSRHHDGFSMFDTKASDYKITSPLSPFRRDVVKELADACHEAGLPFGVYYSQPDWRSPDAFTPERHERYLDFLKMQVRELASNYGRLDIFWFDGLGKPAAAYDGTGLVSIIRGLQPHIVINNRTGLPEDHDTPEQTIGKFQNTRPWESCITIGRQWAWKPNDSLKSLEECLHTLVRCAGGDGNLLFNVGPMPDGRIEPRQVERLRQMGVWLANHGESIYGTRGGPWKPSHASASTRRGSIVFVHVLRWTADPLSLPNLPRKVASATLLSGAKVDCRQSGETLTLSVPAARREEVDTIVKLELDGSAMDIEPLALAPVVKASASSVYRGMEDYGAEMAFDGDPSTRWATDSGTRQAWVTWEFERPKTFAGVRIDEAIASRVQEFEFQIRIGGEWKILFTGKTLGPNFARLFEPVTTTAIRLNILAATDGPTISEIRLNDQ